MKTLILVIFFLGKNLEIFSDSNLFFRRLNFDFFQIQFLFLVKRKTNCVQVFKEGKGHEKCERILVSKVDFD